MDAKQRAAEAAIEFVRSDTVIGLGSGSTADFFLIALSEALKTGRLRNVVGVPTSEQTARRSAELGIPLTTLTRSPVLDVDVDGADEVTPALDLIKGLGGAMLREKIVAQHAGRFIIVGDSSKRVDKLGTKAPLPVEVAKFEHEATAQWLESLGCTAEQRMTSAGEPYVTDNGNYVYHCRFPTGIDDPRALEAALATRAGVIETGLFLGMASVALIAGEDGVVTMRK